jgi:hypothetical protein
MHFVIQLEPAVPRKRAQELRARIPHQVQRKANKAQGAYYIEVTTGCQ